MISKAFVRTTPPGSLCPLVLTENNMYSLNYLNDDENGGSSLEERSFGRHVCTCVLFLIQQLQRLSCGMTAP